MELAYANRVKMTHTATLGMKLAPGSNPYQQDLIHNQVFLVPRPIETLLHSSNSLPLPQEGVQLSDMPLKYSAPTI